MTHANWLLSIFLICTIICWLPCSEGQSILNNKVNVTRYKECIDKWLEKHPHMKGRFNSGQIGWWCQRSGLWEKKANTRPDITLDSQISSKQKGWLTNLRTCKGTACLADVIKQKCEGKRCRRPEHRATPQPRGPKIKPRPRVANSMKMAPIDETFDKIQASNTHTVELPQKEDELPELSIVESEMGKKCQTKAALARLCPVIITASSSKELFPVKVEAIERSGSRNVQRQLHRLEKKFRTLKTRCVRLKQSLDEDNLDFNIMAECADSEKLSKKRKEAGHTCIKVMSAADAKEAFPSMANRLIRLKSASARKQMEDWIEEKFNKSLYRCGELQDKLSAAGESFESWVHEENEEFLKRQRRVRRQTEDTIDLDLVDFRAERKEYRMMTDEERWRFQDTINELKHETIDGKSKYDLLVIYHTPSESPGAHWGPAFLPFHREWLKQLEVALRQIDPDVSIPYWDSTLDEGLPEPKHSILWTDEFLGNGDGEVTTGPFAGWETTHELGFMPGMKRLFRDIGSSPFGGLYKESDLEFTMSLNQYDQLTACIDPTFELVHGVVHMFVGGFMADIAISPNDPSFLMHHGFVDYQWEEFRQTVQTREQREMDYPPNVQACSDFHYANTTMLPFPLKNIEGLSNSYTDEIFYYYPRPQCSDTVPDCGSPYLYCDQTEYRCLSTIKHGGNCKGFEGTTICFEGVCNEQGVCESFNPPEPVTTTEASTSTSTSTTIKPTTPSTTTTITTTMTTPTTTPSTTMTTPTTTPSTTMTTPTTTPSTTMTTPTTTPSTTTTTPTTTPSTTMTTPTTTPSTTTTTPTTPSTTMTTPTTTSSTTMTTPTTTSTTTPTTIPTTRPSTTRSNDEPIDPTADPPFPVVWFTISIVRGPDFTSQHSRTPVPEATVRVTGANVPIGYTQTLSGITMNSQVYPYYETGAIVPVMDPAKAGHFPLVEYKVEVWDESGVRCIPHCYALRRKTYSPCNNKIKLSTNSYYSDPIVFRKTRRVTLQANWAGRGYYKRRKEDYLLFVCPEHS